jgi:hypothetical protein
MTIIKYIFFIIIIFTSTSIYGSNNCGLSSEQTVIQRDSILTVVFDNLKIEFKHSGELEFNRSSNDTIFLSNYSESALTAINVQDKTNEWEIYQRYKTQLFIQFDGKAFKINKWKYHLSPWLQIWFDSKGKNVKSYSYFDHEYFPTFTNDELLAGIKSNRNSFSDYWTDFMIREFSKKGKEPTMEPFYSSIISESHFKIVGPNGRTMYVVVEHSVG